MYRNYDPATARFIAVDPQPESAESLTTYEYSGNNPVMMNDPDGDLLPIPGSHNPYFGHNVGGGDINLPTDLQDAQSAFDSGGGGINAIDPGLANYLATTGQGGISTNSQAVINILYLAAGINTHGGIITSYNFTPLINGDPSADNGAGIGSLSEVNIKPTYFNDNEASQGGDQCYTCLVPSSVGNNISDFMEVR